MYIKTKKIFVFNEQIRMSLRDISTCVSSLCLPSCVDINVTPKLCTHNTTSTTKFPICVHTHNVKCPHCFSELC